MSHVQVFGTMKIPVSIYVLPPDNFDPLDYLNSVLNRFTIHNVSKPDDYNDNFIELLDCRREIIATVEMHDIDIEWEWVNNEI